MIIKQRVVKFISLILAIVVLTGSLSESNVSQVRAKKKDKQDKEETVTLTTVEKANTYDYSVTMSDSGDLLSSREIAGRIKLYGSYTGIPGMPADEYMAAMKYKWKDSSLEDDENARAEVNLSQKYSYKDLVSIMKTLSAYPGVSLYRIGLSTSGKKMFALDVDLTTCAPEEKHTVLLTGQVHARETAGPVFILKELTDILNDYKKGDKRAVRTLKHTRFVTVACVNPDGHDGIGFDLKNWTYKSKELWKATSDGTDLNRNFPGLSWMQLGRGVKPSKYKATSPDKIYYPGAYAGSSSEVKTMMKFYQFFVGVEHAEILVDYHQQGRITYAGKGYARRYNNDLSEELRKACMETQKKGPLRRKYNISYDDTAKEYGREGSGSTNSDYAWAVALGTKFSTQYGFSVYTNAEGAEFPIIMIPHYDEAPVELDAMRSPEFRSMSWEIGSGKKYLGYENEARKLIAKEYYDYNFDEMLYTYDAVLNK